MFARFTSAIPGSPSPVIIRADLFVAAYLGKRYINLNEDEQPQLVAGTFVTVNSDPSFSLIVRESPEQVEAAIRAALTSAVQR